MTGEWKMGMSQGAVEKLGLSGGEAVARRAIDYYKNKPHGRMTESRYRLTVVSPDTGPFPLEVAVVLDHRSNRGFVGTALEFPDRILNGAKTLKDWDSSSDVWDRITKGAA